MMTMRGQQRNCGLTFFLVLFLAFNPSAVPSRALALSVRGNAGSTTVAGDDESKVDHAVTIEDEDLVEEKMKPKALSDRTGALQYFPPFYFNMSDFGYNRYFFAESYSGKHIFAGAGSTIFLVLMIVLVVSMYHPLLRAVKEPACATEGVQLPPGLQLSESVSSHHTPFRSPDYTMVIVTTVGNETRIVPYSEHTRGMEGLICAFMHDLPEMGQDEVFFTESWFHIQPNSLVVATDCNTFSETRRNFAFLVEGELNTMILRQSGIPPHDRVISISLLAPDLDPANEMVWCPHPENYYMYLTKVETCPNIGAPKNPLRADDGIEGDMDINHATSGHGNRLRYVASTGKHDDDGSGDTTGSSGDGTDSGGDKTEGGDESDGGDEDGNDSDDDNDSEDGNDNDVNDVQQEDKDAGNNQRKLEADPDEQLDVAGNSKKEHSKKRMAVHKELLMEHPAINEGRWPEPNSAVEGPKLWFEAYNEAHNGMHELVMPTKEGRKLPALVRQKDVKGIIYFCSVMLVLGMVVYHTVIVGISQFREIDEGKRTERSTYDIGRLWTSAIDKIFPNTSVLRHKVFSIFLPGIVIIIVVLIVAMIDYSMENIIKPGFMRGSEGVRRWNYWLMTWHGVLLVLTVVSPVLTFAVSRNLSRTMNAKVQSIEFSVFWFVHFLTLLYFSSSVIQFVNYTLGLEMPPILTDTQSNMVLAFATAFQVIQDHSQYVREMHGIHSACSVRDLGNTFRRISEEYPNAFPSGSRQYLRCSESNLTFFQVINDVGPDNENLQESYVDDGTVCTLTCVRPTMASDEAGVLTQLTFATPIDCKDSGFYGTRWSLSTWYQSDAELLCGTRVVARNVTNAPRL